MSLNSTSMGERTHIGFFGKRNAGKSSLVNAVTGQDIAVVSDIKGTTTDPVLKSMEILPLGPVVIIDTPGFDDEGSLGKLRVKKAKQVLNKADIAVLVVDSTQGIQKTDEQLIEIFKQKQVPYLVVYSKCDLLKHIPQEDKDSIYLSCKDKKAVNELRERLAKLKTSGKDRKIISDKLKKGDTVVLVTPIDKAAPKGRLILPQQLTIRDIIDIGATAVLTQSTGLCATLQNLKQKPKLVITDSQVFSEVSQIVTEDVPLTSFSILMARYKGFLKTAVEGAFYIEKIKDNDNILISEGCTHHRQCNDIGTVKLPKLLKKFTAKSFNIETSSGTGFPEDLSKYSLIIHCGGCMLNERELSYRQKSAQDANIPFTNYGTAIAHMNGILKRSLEILGNLY